MMLNLALKSLVTALCLSVTCWSIYMLVSVLPKNFEDESYFMKDSPPNEIPLAFDTIIPEGSDCSAVKSDRFDWFYNILLNATHLILNNQTLPLDYYHSRLTLFYEVDLQLRIPDEKNNRMMISEEIILFPDQDRLNATVLASFPRSGNSWLRSLVEGMTGFGTSSMYCDRHLMAKFRWECERSNRFLMKLHYPHKLDTLEALEESETRWIRWQKYEKCIYLVRNPYDSLLSYFMYKETKGEHDIKVDFPQGSLTAPRIKRMIARMKTHWLYWKKDAQLDNLVIRYEDLRRNPTAILLKVFLFLIPEQNEEADLPPTSLLDLYRRIALVVQNDLKNNGLVYATHRYATGYSLPYFSEDAKQLVSEELQDFLAELGYS